MQTLQDREAARLHDGLKDAFRSLFQAFVGRSLDPSIGFLLLERHLGTALHIRPTGMGWTANAATGIFQVATPPAHRRCGYGGAVTSRAVLDGFAAGADLAWLQSSRVGERLYRKLGFRQV